MHFMNSQAAESLRESLAGFPKSTLSHLPTPLEFLPRLSDKLGDYKIYIKRDDCTGLAMGGNKSRQLEYYLGDAVHKGCDTVLSTGAVQSNYMRILAAAAARLGLECHIQLEKRVANDSPDYQHSGNVLLDKLFGAQIHSFAVGEDESGADNALEALAENLSAQGKKPYIVHLSETERPLGALGYVDAALEILQQIESMELKPRMMVVGSGSGLTHAGLVSGLRMAGSEIPVLGACVRRDASQQEARIQRNCARIEKMLSLKGAVSEDIVVDERALWPGYGQQSEMVMQAMHMLTTTEGILTDPVYSGKALAVVVDKIQNGEIEAGSEIILWHTGGTPAIFGYREKMQEIAQL